MRMNIYRQLVFIINDRRTWARAIESNLFQRHMIFHQRQWTAYVGRTLVIEALYEHEQYAKGRIWHIPEHELDRALAILRNFSIQGCLLSYNAIGTINKIAGNRSCKIIQIIMVNKMGLY